MMRTPIAPSCEIVGPVEGSINQIAMHDFKVFKELFDYDFEPLMKRAGCRKVLLFY